MIPIYQKSINDCYEACLSSILEVDVPHFDETSSLKDWLALINYDIIFLKSSPRGYSVLSQLMIDNSIHAVVCFNDQIIHDPSPRPWGRGIPLIWTKLNDTSVC